MWVQGNYQRFSGFHAFGDDSTDDGSVDDQSNPADDEASCAAQGLNFDANTGSCYTTVDPGWSQAGVTPPASGGGGDNNNPSPSPAPSGPSGPSGPSPGGGGGGAPSPGGGAGPSMAPPSGATTASMTGSATPWLLGGAVLLGIIYFAAKSHKGKGKPPHPHHER